MEQESRTRESLARRVVKSFEACDDTDADDDDGGGGTSFVSM